VAGGRDYGASQLNRALARRQPGSAFKPFVYGAAFQSALDGIRPAITPATRVVDEPTVFLYDNKEYTPNNYGQQFYGSVTVREALMRSLNVATVKIAERAGFRRVADFARRAGVQDIQPTPSLALGSYEMTPLEVAGAYTVFPTNGMRAEPTFLDRIVGPSGTMLHEEPSVKRAVDPRVAYLVTSLMVDVLNRGTGAGVRARGFAAPAAGKTGTSHDGWFAGFTSNLVCIVWVGFDDNRELGLSGAASAAPIWAEFMKRAVATPGYNNPQPFTRPQGITSVPIDPESEELAVEGACPVVVDEVFLAGTEPTAFCSLHSGENRITSAAPFRWLSRVFGRRRPSEPPPPAAAAPR
jgi:penicillin-binding protein 1B